MKRYIATTCVIASDSSAVLDVHHLEDAEDIRSA